MKVRFVRAAGLWVGACLWLNASCSGGGSSEEGGAPAPGDGSSAGAGSGSGSAGSAPGFGGGFPVPAGSAGTPGGAGGQGTPGLGTPGVFVPGVCGTTQCTDCKDNDNDGLTDGFDPDCTGAVDDDEGSFATGIPGDNVDACKQDCFFDGNSGSGFEKCLWNLACDEKSPGANDGCPYDPDKNNCPGPVTQQCIDTCLGLVPNGCDCFGCCAFAMPGGGTRNVFLSAGCSYENIGDPSICPTCTPRADCLNPCERCEFCVGKNELPADCAGGGTGAAGSSGTAGGGGDEGPLPTCPAGVASCTPTKPCLGSNSYCLTGCCTAPPPR
jgi:hypothetical protein